MSDIKSAQALLTVAMQDLHAGAGMLAARLPEIARRAGGRLAERLDATAKAAEHRADALAATGRGMDGPDNLWMAGVLDDADRDIRSTAEGNLLDTALIGAIRKALAAEIVSYDTAMALAAALGEAMIGETLARNRRGATTGDAGLKALLERAARG